MSVLLVPAFPTQQKSPASLLAGLLFHVTISLELDARCNTIATWVQREDIGEQP